MALSCVFRAQRASGFHFGAGHLIDILRGNRSEKILQRGHEKLTTFGIGAALGEPEWRAAVEGDPAEAVGIAIRVAVKAQLNELVVDLVMSAVLATAIEGDHAACHLLAHMLNRRSAFEPRAGNLATSWTLASRNIASVRRGHKQSPGMRPPRRHGVAS